MKSNDMYEMPEETYDEAKAKFMKNILIITNVVFYCITFIYLAIERLVLKEKTFLFVPLLCMSFLATYEYIDFNEEQERRRREKEDSKIKLECCYKLVAAKVENQTKLNGKLSGIYLLGFGNTSGNISRATKPIYKYWYKREDGGIMEYCVDKSSYSYPKSVRVIIYENDSTYPKVEIWRNNYSKMHGDGNYPGGYTEFRFTIPTGTFANV